MPPVSANILILPGKGIALVHELDEHGKPVVDEKGKPVRPKEVWAGMTLQVHMQPGKSYMISVKPNAVAEMSARP